MLLFFNLASFGMGIILGGFLAIIVGLVLAWNDGVKARKKAIKNKVYGNYSHDN